MLLFLEYDVGLYKQQWIEQTRANRQFRKPQVFDVQDLKKVSKESAEVTKYQNTLAGEDTVNQETMFLELMDDDSGVQDPEPSGN